MNLFGMLAVSGSALTAERQRAEVVTSNMANMETTRTPEGGPYHRQLVLFRSRRMPQFPALLAGFGNMAARGVRVDQVIADARPPLQRFQPGHPDADAKGYVSYLASCKLSPVGASALLQLDLAVAFPLIDVLLGGQGSSTLPGRQLTEIEEQILETVMRIICRELQSAWQALALEFEFEERQQAEQVQRLMLSEEKTLSLSFDITVAESRGTLNLVFPAVVSNALLRKLSAGWVRAKPRARPDSELRLRQHLLACPFPVDLAMKITGVPLPDLMALSPGTLLVLKCPAQRAAALRASGCEIFVATVARRGWWRAAQVRGQSRPQPERKATS